MDPVYRGSLRLGIRQDSLRVVNKSLIPAYTGRKRLQDQDLGYLSATLTQYIVLSWFTYPHPIEFRPTSDPDIICSPHYRRSFSSLVSYVIFAIETESMLRPTWSVSSIRSTNCPPVAFAIR